MGTSVDKFEYLMETKAQIKEAIREQGVEVTDTDTFRSYAAKVLQISGSPAEDLTDVLTAQDMAIEELEDIAYSLPDAEGEPTLQDKEVVPSKVPQIISADDEFDGIKTVTVLPIPDEYIVPEGSLEVTENNTYDVRSLAEIIVNVEGSGGGSSTPHPELPYSKYIHPDWWDIKTILDEDTGFDGLPSNYTYKTIFLFEPDILSNNNFSLALNSSVYYKTSEGKTGYGQYGITLDRSNDKPYYNENGDVMGYTAYIIIYTSSIPTLSAVYPIRSWQAVKYLEANYNAYFDSTTSGNSAIYLYNLTNMEILQYPMPNCKIALASGSYIAANILKYLAPFTTKITSPDFSWSVNYNNATQLKVVDFSRLQYSKNITFANNIFIEEIRNVNLNKGYILTLTNCKNLRILEIENIRANLTIGSSNTYGHLITKDCLINIIKELIDTGSAKTLTMGTYNTPKIANVYVKLLEDDGSGKLPCEVCESTDEGAMTITDYAGLKNWAIA